MNRKPNITQQELEAIERYLDNAMFPDEQKAFIASLPENPGLQQKINEVRALRDGIEAASLENLLEEFHAEIPLAHSKVVQKPNLILSGKSNRTAYWAIAASIIVLLGVWWFFGKKEAHETLYATHFSPDPGLPTTMSTTENYAFFDAMVDYKMGDYPQAVQKWETQLTNKPDNDTLHYFLGVAKLALHQEGAAISHLEKVIRQPASMFYEDGYHYLGLAKLKQGETEQAKAYFQKSGTEASRAILNHLP